MMRSTYTRGLVWGLCSLSLSWLFPKLALAADPGPSRERDDAELGSHQRNVRVDLGLRTQFISGAGFDPFSENDVLNQFSSSASIAFWARDRLSLAGVVGFDYGASSARARSNEASLDIRRFLVAPEVRYHLLPVLALTARLGPTLTREAATLAGGLDTDLAKTAWLFGFDATAGAAVEVWGYANPTSHKPRLWVTGEAGYGYTASNRLSLEPRDPGLAPQRATPVELGELSLGGPLFRITAALSFW